MKHRKDVNILRKVLGKFTRYQVGRQQTKEGKIRAKANIYRHLHNFQTSIDEAMKEIEKDLLEANVEEYFLDENEKVIVHSHAELGKFVECDNFSSTWDRVKAVRQKKAREKNV